MKIVRRVILIGVLISVYFAFNQYLAVRKQTTKPYLVKQKDMRSHLIRRVVALGESTTWGYCVSSKDKSWVNQTVALLEEFQGAPIELVNQGIGFNVLTPKCPGYPGSAKPSALERVEQDVIALKPDMIFLSYGLNDSRGGISLSVFREEYQKLIDRIQSDTDAIIVILNVYYMHESAYKVGWDRSNYRITEQFNKVIADLAEKNGLILADIWSAEKGVDWIIDQDHVHANDLGHKLIANRVFEAIARNCSFVARTMPKQSQYKSFVQKYGNGPAKK